MADFLMLVIVDKTDGTYSFLQFNRDTMTEISLINHDGKGAATATIQLCTAHWYGGTKEQSCKNTVKAVKIDGAEASVDNVKNGSYKVVRPFNIVLGKKTSDAANDFVNYIMSADGQKIIEDNGYIPVDEGAAAYQASNAKGKVVVGGSSSVSPVMEKLVEAYSKANTNIQVDVQTTDSTTGVSSTVEGSYDIGMASRDLKDDETAQGVEGKTIAKDGIAVIVNNESSVDELSTDQVKSIFTGETTSWSDITK